MFTAFVGAALIGLGLLYAVTTAFPAPVAPDRQPEPYAPSHRPAHADTEPRSGPLTRAATPMAGWLQHLGLPREPRRRDLALLERDTATHVAAQIASSLALALLGTGFFVLMHAGGLRIPAAYLPLCAAIPAVYGAAAPNSSLKAEAAARRDELRQVTSSFLTLASLVLAAGGNVNEALATASQAGNGPAAGQLRGAIAYAETSGTPAWDALAELGRRADVPELTELGAAVNLAGVEGARLRATLTTKAKSLRERLLAAREAAENTATEKTALPTALLMLGYLLLVATPAAVSAIHAL